MSYLWPSQSEIYSPEKNQSEFLLDYAVPLGGPANDDGGGGKAADAGRMPQDRVSDAFLSGPVASGPDT